MKSPVIGGLVGIAFACTTSAALAQAKPQTKIDFGALEYSSTCAACHGLAGKGDGSYSAFLTHRPSDLTTLAKRNGGVFPVQRVYEVIDGRQAIPAHGTRDMAIWGEHYKGQATFYYSQGELPGPHDTEAFVRVKILALVDYLNRLQVK